MRTKDEEKKLRATYKYYKPLTITVDGPVGNGRTQITGSIFHWLDESNSVIVKYISDYKLQIEIPCYRKKGK